MRALFSVAGLLIVVAVIAILARKQLAALGIGAAATRAPAAMATAGEGSPATVPEQARSLQQKTQTDVMKALESGVQQRASSPQ